MKRSLLLHDEPEPESDSDSETWTSSSKAGEQSRFLEAKSRGLRKGLTNLHSARRQNKQNSGSNGVKYSGNSRDNNRSLYTAALKVHKVGNKLKVTRKINGVRVDNQHCWFEIHTVTGTNNRFNITVGYLAGGATLVSSLNGYRQPLGQKFIDINMLIPVVELSRSPDTDMYIEPADLDQFSSLKLSQTIAEFLAR